MDRIERTFADAHPTEGVRLMPRKLRTYQTSIGFFELAVAAPSMKAALEAWGSKSNLFHQGLAIETQDPAIIAATMAEPGVVLRRAVGSSGTFSKKAALPRDLGVHTVRQTRPEAARAEKEPQARKGDDKAAIAAALAFEREKERRERGREKEAAAREKRREKRERAIAKAEATLEEAKRVHEAKIEEIEAARSALNRELQAEDARWLRRRAALEAILRQARE